MNIVCLDLEGVLVPEIWIAFSEESGIPELKRTTLIGIIDEGVKKFVSIISDCVLKEI